MNRRYTKQSSAIVANIRAIRIKKELSQIQVASKLEISQNAYSKLELGYCKLRVDQLICISEILDVPVQMLIDI
ncbi:helix-turn-helix transcriptional regulator [Mucilaginibacter sp. 21P]|uniref:helix-turn-helix domain-containing protein n=1 Tax=Mucilaginibacter sp. 21P TaxID=2778902 RepID=UPI001C58547B|nr:helix-turn-helix transcriptional regulator [Mucilaginibacter sp. 21P]QXV66812.1 helix-turn-helix transcriptional regulator [Mucilaginibacter sp. 21P]